MSLTPPSDGPTVVRTTFDPPSVFGRAAAYPGVLYDRRWHSILCQLAQIDNTDECLIALRQMCDDYSLNYGAIFAKVATYAPGLLP